MKKDSGKKMRAKMHAKGFKYHDELGKTKGDKMPKMKKRYPRVNTHYGM